MLKINNISLWVTVIEEFANWLKLEKPIRKLFLDVEIKLATFQLIIKQKNMEFIKMVAATYEFIEHKEEFLPIIKVSFRLQYLSFQLLY